MLPNAGLADLDRRAAAAQELVAATIDMAASGRPLMRRVVPETGYRVWDHYPADDAVDLATGSRWFYHAHPPEERGENEHGHFHIFLDREAFGDLPALAAPVSPGDAGVVHVAALAIDTAGLPTHLFTVNRWVTDEWLFGATDILERLPDFDLSDANGDALVNRWLTAAVAIFKPEIAAILAERDRRIAGAAPPFFEDRNQEILSSIPIDLERCVTQLDR